MMMKKLITTGLVIAFGALWTSVAPAADVKDKAESAGTTVKDKAVSTKDTVKEKATEIKDKVSSKLHRSGKSDGASSSDVRDVQLSLKDQGYNPGAIDGKMGPKTHAALMKFQRDHQLTASGNLDSDTKAALHASASLKPANGTAATTGGGTQNTARDLGPTNSPSASPKMERQSK